jgi:hypothetical protein
VASLALRAGSRYRRAGVLDRLLDTARGEDVAAASRARTVAARHVDQAGASLSAIEADRVRAVLATVPDDDARERLEERLDRLRHLAETPTDAAALAAGLGDREAETHRRRVEQGPGPRPRGGRSLTGWLGLALIDALERGEVDAPRQLALEATTHLLRGRSAGVTREAPLWTAARFALLREVPEAPPLIAALLEAPGEPPPRGFSELAACLEAEEEPDLAAEAWAHATLHRETGARGRLGARLREQAWEAARRGDGRKALALLRRAAPLLGRQG